MLSEMCLFAKETGHEIVILRIKPVTKKTKSNVNIEHLLMKNLSNLEIIGDQQPWHNNCPLLAL